MDKIGDKVENFLILLKSVFDVSRETPKKEFFPSVDNFVENVEKFCRSENSLFVSRETNNCFRVRHIKRKLLFFNILKNKY
ncbi:MAG: hypothetical protein IJZ27_00035 [Treponema sp.]|nr:hypothetical protein [Treponema sp.]